MNRKERSQLPKPDHKGNPLEKDILKALGDFTDAIEKGEVRQRFTCRQIKLDLVPTEYDPALVKETRDKLRISQALFAKFLGASVKTISAWEQGTNTPPPMACRFMDEIRHNPKYWRRRLRESAVAQEVPQEEGEELTL